MALEIRELIIKAELGTGEGAGQAAPSGKKGAGEKEQIVRACVEQVLEIMRERKER